VGQVDWYVDEQRPEGVIRADFIHSDDVVELGAIHQRVDGQHPKRQGGCAYARQPVNRRQLSADSAGYSSA
ncbi:hypothetical protein, partial [Pseudoalteromonas ruthenica]|uniref:hypothetical protein n=1 Tax=Pseudoalteromonas ruthenica TaxID=151081 RepID=UPI00127776A2